jgi:ubiquinone/menaquinone biosynthesis C-methylase UbiE
METDIKSTHIFVKETKFGDWFINTKMWQIRVIDRALDDLVRLIPQGQVKVNTVLDVGCGFGHSFQSLYKKFQPNKIIGLDADPDIQKRAGDAALKCTTPVTLVHASANDMSKIADAEVDMVFCHQSFHHIIEQEQTMREFYRVLKPNGLLLFAESTKYYIETLQIRMFFRHPMHVQKTADEYIAIIRHAGFDVPQQQISLPYLWWSRPDGGFFEWVGLPVPEKRDETLVNVVAVKKA